MEETSLDIEIRLYVKKKYKEHFQTKKSKNLNNFSKMCCSDLLTIRKT